jgi:hypothetical protein
LYTGKNLSGPSGASLEAEDDPDPSGERRNHVYQSISEKRETAGFKNGRAVSDGLWTEWHGGGLRISYEYGQNVSADISGDRAWDPLSESKPGEKALQGGEGRPVDVDRSLRSDCGCSRSAALEKHGDPSGVDPVQMVGFSVLVR